MPDIDTIFWGWDSPLIEKAIEWLTRGRARGRSLDLSDTIIVVPTAEASRRLREALATVTAEDGAAVMAPWVWHPEQCLNSDEDRRRAATGTQIALAWMRVMQESDLAKLPKLFLAAPERKTAGWAAEMARTLADLQSALGAGGMRFDDVARSEHAAIDHARWSELASLERSFEDILSARGVIPPQISKLRRAEAPFIPPEVRRICVLGVADAPPLFSRWLQKAAKHCAVTVCIQAPASFASSFSTVGQPLVSHWGEKAKVVMPLAESQLHIDADSAAQAKKAEQLMSGLLIHGRTAVGVCDTETTAHLLDRLEAQEVRAYEPGGRPVAQHGFVHLVRLWRDLVETESWKVFASLIRLPAFTDALNSPGLPGVSLLRAADDFADKRLPVDLRSAWNLMKDMANDRDAGRWKALQGAVKMTLAMIDAFKSQSLPVSVREWLLKLYGKHPFRADQPHERELMKLTTSWIQTADSLAHEAARLGAKMSSSEALRLSVDLLAEGKLGDPRGDIDLVIQGWLELLWEPAPHLIVLGCNEENLPGILVSHPFLPDRLREALGLPCQATRYARDAYLMTALASQREKTGALHLICGQWSERGDAVRPSRLLFLCEDEALPQRVAHLFPKDGGESTRQSPPRTWIWKLRPRAVAADEDHTISVSRLNDYLDCPFRYYLKRELGMSAVDASKAEMSAVEFGQLIHAAFKALADDATLRDCTDEKQIAAFLCHRATAEAARLYGRRLPFTVRLQLDSALQRLHAAAAFEAAHRADGWRTLHGEFELGEASDASPLMIGSRRLRGKIDRIDQRGSEVLILDFKTSESARRPEDAHLNRLKKSEAGTHEEWRVHPNADGKACRWCDLQLPLYVRAWSLRHSGPVSAGYFLLPTNVQDTTIEIWRDLDASVLDAAMRCAEEAVSRLDRRIFWPPHGDVDYDDFAQLFGGFSPEQVVDPGEIIGPEAAA